jgi:hypothetical protein
MDDVAFRARIDDSCSVYISPIDRETYDDQIGSAGLGGHDGYFLMLSRRTGLPRLEVLAKVPTLFSRRAVIRDASTRR